MRHTLCAADALTAPCGERGLTRLINMTLQRLKEPHYRFVRVFFAQMFLRTDAFTPFMREVALFCEGLEPRER